MTKRGGANRLPMRDVRESVIPGGLIAHWERALVGQLARDTHAAGEQFVAWPSVRHEYTREVDLLSASHFDSFRRTEICSPEEADIVTIRIEVETEKRP